MSSSSTHAGARVSRRLRRTGEVLALLLLDAQPSAHRLYVGLARQQHAGPYQPRRPPKAAAAAKVRKRRRRRKRRKGQVRVTAQLQDVVLQRLALGALRLDQRTDLGAAGLGNNGVRCQMDMGAGLNRPRQGNHPCLKRRKKKSGKRQIHSADSDVNSSASNV
ncbi:hypothetical protein DFJ73DRAFT_760478 [Zopfochytrium polystomum]|nr:hypothetical protein DFJ73DRAFT_760478 [Zopfochytrium polystomum]